MQKLSVLMHWLKESSVQVQEKKRTKTTTRRPKTLGTASVGPSNFLKHGQTCLRCHFSDKISTGNHVTQVVALPGSLGVCPGRRGDGTWYPLLPPVIEKFQVTVSPSVLTASLPIHLIYLSILLVSCVHGHFMQKKHHHSFPPPSLLALLTALTQQEKIAKLAMLNATAVFPSSRKLSL